MCINFLKKSRKNKPYFYCRLKKKEITFEDCNRCGDKEYKKNKAIKKKTNKLKKLEAERYSIITDDLTQCYLCGTKKMDTHELIGGCNRQTSMKWGLTIPICRKCHSKLDTDILFRRELEKLGQRAFEIKYNHELFMSEFKRNYL